MLLGDGVDIITLERCFLNKGLVTPNGQRSMLEWGHIATTHRKLVKNESAPDLSEWAVCWGGSHSGPPLG